MERPSDQDGRPLLLQETQEIQHRDTELQDRAEHQGDRQRGPVEGHAHTRDVSRGQLDHLRLQGRPRTSVENLGREGDEEIPRAASDRPVSQLSDKHQVHLQVRLLAGVDLVLR